MNNFMTYSIPSVPSGVEDINTGRDTHFLLDIIKSDLYLLQMCAENPDCSMTQEGLVKTLARHMTELELQLVATGNSEIEVPSEL